MPYSPTRPVEGTAKEVYGGVTVEGTVTAEIGNPEVTVFASAARTASANSADMTNAGTRGARFTLDITAVAGTAPTLDVKIQAKDSVSGKYVDIAGASFTQKSAAGTDELVVYPGVAETANESVSDVLPRTWRAVATIGGVSPSFTFSLAAAYVP